MNVADVHVNGSDLVLAVVLGIAGLIWGVVADRVGARWPAHEDGSVRCLDWRTVVVAIFGAVALAAVPIRFGVTAELVLFGFVFAMFTLQMATDLDQRLLPAVLTLPVIVVAALAIVWGGNSLVNRQPALLAAAAAIALPAALYLLSKPFGEGAFGEGDVTFLVGAGLLLGALRLVLAVFAGVMVSAFVIGGLLLTRRISLRSYVPFGPFLIIGTLWAALLPAAS
jgi:leader peptidase (prepilin peptidase)/N-methyltransferase